MSEPTQLRPVQGGKTPKPPGSIRAKVLKVADAMPVLKKKDRNPYENYAFVSIDDYYDTAGRALIKEGVGWTCTEEEFRYVAGDTFCWRFRFDVYDEASTWENAARFTVPHAMEGPQTAGKVVSYAEKVFLRQLLKLVTGEPDADQSRAKPRLAKDVGNARGGVHRTQDVGEVVDPLPDAETGLPVDDILAAIRNLGSEAGLDQFVTKHKKQILHLQKNDPDVYQKIAAARTAKLEEFSNVV